ncbi:MAG: aminomethyl-transferring glycine dehydrogenase [Acidimicrobiales bacterium]
MSNSPSFSSRHIGPSEVDRAAMLQLLGFDNVDELLEKVVPRAIRTNEPPTSHEALSEPEAIDRLRTFADNNVVATSLLGLGYHDTVTPPVIARNILENPAWYTAYTPYQAEISQGRLEAVLNFQTMISDLTGRELTNASLLDEPTAAAEAMTLLARQAKGDVFVVDQDCLPQTIEVVRTRAEPLGIQVHVGDAYGETPEGTFGVLVQYPGASGGVRPLAETIDNHHHNGVLVAVAADLLALCLLQAPGDVGADVVVGSAQRFGVPMGFGGPHAGYMAARDDYKRSMPGRIVGVSVDDHGRPALRLALQTREQHIRRERATSNICTAQVLLAVIAGSYAVYHGPEGLTEIAEQVHALTNRTATALQADGFALTEDGWFDTITVEVPGRADEIVEAALGQGINLRRVSDDAVGISFNETNTLATAQAVVAAFGSDADVGASEALSPLDPSMRRSSAFLEHPVFHRHRSETEMLRYLRKLADRDLALDRSMIPLGSCTMKLNATTEMIPITWPEFSRIHPFAPMEQARGYLDMINDLADSLCQITGYDAVSLQPNAGSQGEFAGLLAIRAYHRSQGDDQRDACLIPSSAHGTNAASAAMAGMRVVVVACDDNGNVDIADLETKCRDLGDSLAAVMITYPSTHGVFEERVTEICDLVHSHGGQVYLDGANLNALVGQARPGDFGADVSHLNLHKTFCIPHGGGGPGVGPVGVRQHLAPFLPNHPLVEEAGPETGVGPISGAPWGSAGILPISWTYIALMGGAGLEEATEVAILSANYMARRLDPHFPVLYRGERDMVAHECIIDLRDITRETGVTVDDVAKRLMDYGFHAPTMSFPVAGTLMIEPTESESLAEIDRFCDAMISIRQEVEDVVEGKWPVEESPLRQAPHTAIEVSADQWDRPYPRSHGGYPTPLDPTGPDKYWPPVGRIDGAHGDKNLVCSCPPLSAYE